jgi:hypothetical protein
MSKQKEKEESRQFSDFLRSSLRELSDSSNRDGSLYKRRVQEGLQRIEKSQSPEEKRYLIVHTFAFAIAGVVEADRAVNATVFEWLLGIVERQGKLIEAFVPQLKGYSKLSREMRSYAPILRQIRKRISQKRETQSEARTAAEFFEKIWARQLKRGLIV